MGNRLGKRILFGLMAILLVGSWLYRSETGLADARTRSGERVLDYAAAQLPAGFGITLRLSGSAGSYTDDEALASFGRELAGMFLSTADGTLDRSGNTPFFRANGVMDGLGQLDVMVIGSEDRRSRFVIMRLDTSSKVVSRDRLCDWQALAERTLRERNIRGSWNVIAQGLLPADSGDDETLIAKAADAFRGKAEERYTDDGTISVSFDAADLSDEVRSGDHRISLQLAIRHLTGSDERRLTIGTPVITTEY